jgi:hypothetical protein
MEGRDTMDNATVERARDIIAYIREESTYYGDEQMLSCIKVVKAFCIELIDRGITEAQLKDILSSNGFDLELDRDEMDEFTLKRMQKISKKWDNFIK